MAEPLARADVTGLVLAGGRGSRMGGVDKGLQPWQGRPLVQHALQRLAPQVGPLMVNANRNADAYRTFGVPVWPDEPPDYAGPLAGFLAGLMHCSTSWLVTVPCDSPLFPADLVDRLGRALQQAGADVAVAATQEQGRVQPQPVFCLLRASLCDDLRQYLQAGGRKIDAWTGRQRHVLVGFDDGAAFFNANTPDDLRRPAP